MINRVALVTGGFDPLHKGHIHYFREARSLANLLLVGVNSASWLERKKGKEFMPSSDRIEIIKHLKMVEGVFLFDDSDDTAIEAINNAKMLYPNSLIIFCNGGDRTSNNIPELDHFKDDSSVEFRFGVGGTKKLNSSSNLLDNWQR